MFPPHRTASSSLSVLFATPECAPLVKTGGLGDVSGALPAALRAEGVDARVLLPGYREVLAACVDARELARVDVVGFPVRLLESALPDGTPLIVADCPQLFARPGGPYQTAEGDDWKDNAVRFGVLSRVAALLGTRASPLSWHPPVVHGHDWPLGLAPVFLRSQHAPRAASVITIHNLAFQGIFPYADLDPLHIPAASRGMEGIEFFGKASFLKGGLVYADAITTVSPTYAREIQTRELGFGLEGVLGHRRAALFGVLNGIDTALWNPMADPHLPSAYDASSLERKAANKRALRERFGLGGRDDALLLGCVSRITHQKGMDLVAEAIPRLVALGAQLAIVGTGDRRMVERLKAAHAADPAHVGLVIGFDEGLAHLVEGGADAFLMPSRFEPCGMNQMYSQRYGTPPIAHATGGLVDTIVDDPAPDATGFLLREASADALLDGCRRALAAYRDPAHWRRLQVNGMRRDFGWGPAARSYIDIYKKLGSG